MSKLNRPAPAWQIEQWFNTPTPLTLESLRGKVIALESFQMLCPGCVSHGLPQATRIRASFAAEDVAVIGLHTVFEHHAAMTPTSLQAFLHEYRIHFPVGVDRAGIDGAPTPRTMSAYFMQGTPTLTLIDAAGVIRYQYFGQVSDMLLGAQIAELVQEANALRSSTSAIVTEQKSQPQIAGCDEQGCTI
ncbi:MAG: redoxin family protein [Cellvibrio sp.]|uniref:redoxin family protein n=1 Tax=Cellvibrio sp. TaxID=1965322 RepID=UPI00319FE95E